MFPINLVHLDSSLAFTYFLSGVASVLSGISLLEDDRFLNKYLLSLSLIILGGNNISKGFYLIGHDIAEAFEVIFSVLSIALAISSIELIRRYKKIRRKKMLERGEKP